MNVNKVHKLPDNKANRVQYVTKMMLRYKNHSNPEEAQECAAGLIHQLLEKEGYCTLTEHGPAWN